MPHSVRLFDVDSELLAHVPAADRDLALRAAVLPVLRLGPGPWTPAPAHDRTWGILAAEGLLIRDVGVAGASAAELVGAGDLLLVGASACADAMVATEEAWTVLEPATLVVLEQRFTAVARRWPLVTACLLERAERRAVRLAVAQAIGHLHRVDIRVLVMLWSLADRWGRVSSDGIVMPLRLTHRTIARLVGARRPSVTTAVSELVRRDLVGRRDDGSWLLKRAARAELARLGLEPLSAHPASSPRRGDLAAP